MNRIRINQLLLAGLVTFVVWIAVELLVEQVVGRILFGESIQQQWVQTTDVLSWGVPNYVLNILIALVNCMILIWLYAALRPMYGVGTKTALITSAFGVIFGFSVTLNGINLGLFPPQLGMVEFLYELIEFPIAMLAGAWVYEGMSEPLVNF
jgi:hypothetical protein